MVSGNLYPPPGLRFFSQEDAFTPAKKTYSNSNPLLPCAVNKFTPLSLPATCTIGKGRPSFSINSIISTKPSRLSKGLRLVSSFIKSKRAVSNCINPILSSLCIMYGSIPAYCIMFSNNPCSVLLATAAINFSRMALTFFNPSCMPVSNKFLAGVLALSYNNFRMEDCWSSYLLLLASTVSFAISIGGIV